MVMNSFLSGLFLPGKIFLVKVDGTAASRAAAIAATASPATTATKPSYGTSSSQQRANNVSICFLLGAYNDY